MNNLKTLKQFAKGSKVEQQVGKRYCVIYTRVSTKEQAETQSLEWQKKYCNDYAAKQNLEVLGYFGGTYESAKNDERKEFGRMMRQLNLYKQKVSFILVYSLDRFSRSGENAIYISSELKKKGVNILSVTQPMDASTNTGTLQQNIHFIFSKYDNDQRRQKSVDGMREKLKRGEWLGNCPTGYSYDRTHGTKEQRIIINEKGELIRKAFYWRMEGVSNPEIIDRLEALGMKLPIQTLSDVFRNPFYCGLVSHNFLEGELVKGKHPALIPEEVFLRVNKLNKKDGYNVENDNPALPLKQFLKCAKCGTTITGYIVAKKNLYYYKCNKRKCKCNKSTNRLHDMFMELLSKFQIVPKLVQACSRQMMYTYENLTERSSEATSGLTKKLNEVSGKLDNVMERYATGEIDKTVYDKVAVKLDAEKKQIEENLEKSRIRISNPKEVLEYVSMLSSKLASTWASSAYGEKRIIQKMIFPKGLSYHRENDEYLTTRPNRVFQLISSLTDDPEKNKSRISSFFLANHGLVHQPLL
ncbi:MAG: recombinase family protein [Bacteroidota bacterium]